MATKNLEETKTKLINKLYEVRHDIDVTKTKRRHDRTFKRSLTLEKKYSIIVKQSFKEMIIGKDVEYSNSKLSQYRNLTIDNVENL